MQCLLDKVTVRHGLLGILKINKNQPLLDNELSVLDLMFETDSTENHLTISPNTANLLNQFAQSPIYEAAIHTLLQRVSVISPTRYFKRWSRRLREYGFTREDAAILALATFASPDGVFSSMDYVITFDQRMINNWLNRQEAIDTRFQAMRVDLIAPYIEAKLPQVIHPEQMDE